MARPTKQGLDYFSLDTNIDTKLELFEAEHGLAGFGFLIKLFQKIYSNGYYYEWNEDEQLLFSKQINVDINQINVYINSALKRNIFSKEIYEKYNILTSRGIQKRFLEACRRRKQIEMIKEITLIDFDNISYQEFLPKIIYVSNNLINVDNNIENVNINSVEEELIQHNANNNSQSKVNKSKGKESKADAVKNKLSEITKYYEANIALVIPATAPVLIELSEKFDKELVFKAIDIACEKNKRSLSYVKGILSDWDRKGYKILADIKQEKGFKKQDKDKELEFQKQLRNKKLG